jgi:hypothetical protein
MGAVMTGGSSKEATVKDREQEEGKPDLVKHHKHEILS